MRGRVHRECELSYLLNDARAAHILSSQNTLYQPRNRELAPVQIGRVGGWGAHIKVNSYMWEYGDILASSGPERLSMMHAYRTAIDMDIPVAGHSDSPVSAAYPLLRIPDMVTRKSSQGMPIGGNQKVSVDEAIKVWTLDGAYATFEEKIKGSIIAGKLADFVVLQEDPRKVAPDTIKDIVIEATYLGGQKVYSSRPDGSGTSFSYVLNPCCAWSRASRS